MWKDETHLWVPGPCCAQRMGNGIEPHQLEVSTGRSTHLLDLSLILFAWFLLRNTSLVSGCCTETPRWTCHWAVMNSYALWWYVLARVVLEPYYETRIWLVHAGLKAKDGLAIMQLEMST